MPRTLNATLEASLDNGQFDAYFLLTAKETGFGTIRTVYPTSFKLSGIEMQVKYPAQTTDVYDGFSKPESLSFILTRGITIAGTNYTLDSSEYFGTSSTWDSLY